MSSLIIFASLILTFAICAGLSVYLWSARRSPLHRLVLFTQAAYALWAFLILMTSLATDYSHKVLLTEARQLFLPLLGPTWLLVGVGIFYRSFWDMLGKAKYLIYIFPCLVILGHLCSILDFPFAREWTFYDFSYSVSSLGLLKYKSGLLINLSFAYIYVCLATLYVLYLFTIFTKTGAKRKYATLLALAGLFSLALEVLGRVILNIPDMVQVGVAAIWPAAWTLHYAVTKMELLDIGALAYEKVFESLPSPVLIFDSSKNFWNGNKAAFEVFDLRTSMIGKPAETLPMWNGILNQKGLIEVKQKNYQIVRHDLPLKDREVSASIYILSDVTDLQERNETLQELNEQVIKMMKFSQKIHTILSHDMTGSLVGMRMLLNGMKKEFTKKNDAESAEAIERLVHSSQSSLDLLQDILTWSIEDERTLRASLQKCLSDSLVHLTPQVHAKNIKISQFLPDQVIYFNASSKMVESIFRNLLSNAIKFSSTNGLVRVEADLKDSKVAIHIIDEGVGMSEETIAKILAGHEHQDGVESGFGIGLRFTLGFVEQLGGRMIIESTLGKGAHFILELPIA
ncbi:sensor histidine kinase [Bdellovibrio svalbardensis]|uniref:histidine kinase n=1 Tax=Bdellovibrio svalbardensis TaxID=2972972 RepID=A0ABT6DQS4_9BACT|nr:sensor histidine kinase [Bdellovibrio svalbardensis]MDG0818176.1 ATP-binding protein [Bdellovibrio svalbardensis]